MTHGKKFLNMRSKRFIIVTLIGCLILSTITIKILVFPNTLPIKIFMDTRKVNDILKNKRFIHVVEEDIERDDGYNRHDFDLLKKRYFGGDVAITGSKIYGIDREPNKVYQIYYNNYLTSAIKNSNLTVRDIQKNDYKVIIQAKEIIQKKFLSEANPPTLEQAYKIDDFSEAQITFNRDYLPIRLEIRGRNKNWKVMRTYSYPYNNEEEFDKALDKYIEYIEYWELPDDAMDD